MQLFETVVHDDKANILNSISTNIYLESLTSEVDPYSILLCHVSLQAQDSKCFITDFYTFRWISKLFKYLVPEKVI